jgi:hypothetical protein
MYLGSRSSSTRQVMKLRQMRFRALITLDPAGTRFARSSRPWRAPAQRYLNHTHALMVQAPRLCSPGGTRIFPAEICWDEEGPLYPGDRAEVTITVIDDEAPEFLDGGPRITLWAGGHVGHGTITRRVFTEYGPY